jgi:hypothetical protein
VSDLLCGLDLGQVGDYTALAIVRRLLCLSPAGLPKRSLRGDLIFRFECVHLERYQLGTPYPAVVAAVKEMLSRPQLGDRPRLVIDATGVGRAVVDLFLNDRLSAIITPLTITAGDTVRTDSWHGVGTHGVWVPKNELVSAIRANLESGRLKVAKPLRLAETLKKELLDFRVRVTKAANETFTARDGAHDDLVLAVAMAVWLGGERRTHYERPSHAETLALDEEIQSERAALQQEADDESASREREWRNPDNPVWWAESRW